MGGLVLIVARVSGRLRLHRVYWLGLLGLVVLQCHLRRSICVLGLRLRIWVRLEALIRMKHPVQLTQVLLLLKLLKLGLLINKLHSRLRPQALRVLPPTVYPVGPLVHIIPRSRPIICHRIVNLRGGRNCHLQLAGAGFPLGICDSVRHLSAILGDPRRIPLAVPGWNCSLQ